MNRFLFALAKTWLGGVLLHWIMSYFSFIIPGEKLIENNSLVAFHHPAPSYPLHILIVPKTGYRSLADLPSADLAFETALFEAVQDLVARFKLIDSGYRLVANGGNTQEVDHLHFHLIAD